MVTTSETATRMIRKPDDGEIVAVPFTSKTQRRSPESPSLRTIAEEDLKGPEQDFIQEGEKLYDGPSSRPWEVTIKVEYTPSSFVTVHTSSVVDGIKWDFVSYTGSETVYDKKNQPKTVPVIVYGWIEADKVQSYKDIKQPLPSSA